MNLSVIMSVSVVSVTLKCLLRSVGLLYKYEAAFDVLKENGKTDKYTYRKIND